MFAEYIFFYKEVAVKQLTLIKKKNIYHLINLI